MNQTKTTLKELTARYRAVLLKCAVAGLAVCSASAEATQFSDGTNTYIGSFGVPLTVYDNDATVGTFYGFSWSAITNAEISGVTATLDNASCVGTGLLSLTQSTNAYAEISTLTAAQITTATNNLITVLTAMNNGNKNYNALPAGVKAALEVLRFSGGQTIAEYLQATWPGASANMTDVRNALLNDYENFNSFVNTPEGWDATVSIADSTLTLNGTSAVVNRAKVYPGSIAINNSTIIANGTNALATYSGLATNITMTGGSLLQVNNGATLTIQSSGNRVSLTNSNLTLNGTITGNVSLSGTAALQGTGTISGNLDAASASVLNMQNGAIDAFTASTVTGGSFSVALDVNATGGAIDRFTADTFTTGTITISGLNFLSAEQNFTLTVLNGDASGATLVLSDAVSTAYNTDGSVVEWRNNLTPAATWETAFTKTKYTVERTKTLTVQNNKTLVFTVVNGAETQGETVSLGNTLDLLNTMTAATRTMTNSTSAASFTLTGDLGATSAGTFTINGAKADTSAATINMASHTGFSVGADVTLNLQKIVFAGNTGDAGSVLTVAGGAAALSNVTIGNAVSVTSGTLTLSGGNALGGLNNTGTVTLTGENRIGAMSGAGTLTNNGSLTLNGATNAQIIGGTGRTYIDAALTTTAAINQAITINGGRMLTASAEKIGGAVTNGGVLALTGGTLDRTVSGGAVHINGNVTSNVSLSNVTISAGNVLTIGAGNVGTGLTNNGTLSLSGGTLTKAVSGTVQIDGDVTSQVLVTDTVINAGHTLTIGANNVGTGVTNGGTLVLTEGTLHRAVSGAGAFQIDGNVVSAVDLANVTINAGKKLTINANYIGEGEFTNNGTLALSGGVLIEDVAGTGAIRIDGEVISLVSMGNTTINPAGELMLFADDVGANLTNNGTLALSGGTLNNSVAGAGETEIIGNVVSNVALSKAKVDEAASLTIAADKIRTEMRNEGDLILTGGTLSKALTGAGVVRISGDVVSETGLSNVTVDAGRTLTLDSGHVGAGFTNNGTVVLTGGEISNPLSGNVTMTGYTEMKTGADFTGAHIDLTGGELGIGTNALVADAVTGGRISLDLKEYAAAEPIVTTTPAGTVKLEIWPFDVTNKAVQHYTLTSTDNGYSIDFILPEFFAVSKTPFAKEDAMTIGEFDEASWTGGDLYIVALNVAEIAASELVKNGYALKTEDRNAVQKLSDDVEDRLTGQYQANYEAINDALIYGFIEEDYGRIKTILAEAGTDTTPAAAQTAVSNAQTVMSVVSSRLGGAPSSPAAHGRSGGDFVAGNSAVWAQGLVNKAKLSGTNGFDSDSTGFAAGYEYNIDDSYKVGAGYAFSSTDIKTERSKTGIDTHTFFVYGEYKPDALYIDGTLSYGRSKYDERTRMLGLKSDYKADTLALQAKAGYALEFFTPEAGLRYMNVAEKAYTDFLGARVSGRTTQTWTVVAGANAAKDFVFEKGTVSGRVSAALTYDLTQGGANRTVSLVNGTSYIVRGENLPRFGFEFGAGVSYKLNDKTEIGLSYDGKFKKRYSDHTGILNVKYAF